MLLQDDEQLLLGPGRLKAVEPTYPISKQITSAHHCKFLKTYSSVQGDIMYMDTTIRDQIIISSVHD